MMTEREKKIYTVEITGQGQQNGWYRMKVGSIYEAELKARGYKDAVAFYVGGNKFINPIHCKVLSEKIIC